MSTLFLYGAMARREVLEQVIQTNPATMRAAELPGYRLPDNPVPLALANAGAGGVVEGCVLTGLDAEQTKRTKFVMQALGGAAVDVTCVVDGAECRAQAYLAETPHASRTDPRPIAEIEQLAVAEITGYSGRLPAAVVAQRRTMILARAAARVAALTPKPSNLRSDRPSSDINLHDQSAEHEGFFLTRSYQIQHPKFDGTISPVLRREAFVATDAAIVLPYDPVRDRVLLVEQFRMGPYGRGDAKPWMLEPVAGRVDAGESPETCARRECLEEAGLELRELIKISSHYCSPGCSTEYFHLYLGLCDLPDDRPSTGGLDTEHEDLALHVISYDQAQALLETGEADNGPLVLSLLWLSKRRDALRASA